MRHHKPKWVENIIDEQESQRESMLREINI